MANSPAKQTGTEIRPVEKFVEFLVRRIQEDEEYGAQDFALSQLDSILAAENLTDMWDADDYQGMAGQNLVDVEQNILSVIYRESDKYDSGIMLPNGKRAYVLVRSVRLDTGEEFVWNTGASLLIGKLRWLEAMGYFGKPEANCVIKGTEAGEGTVLKLKPVPARAVKGETI